jgi:hypothetical protein
MILGGWNFLMGLLEFCLDWISRIITLCSFCPMEVPHQTTNKQFHFESAWFLDNSYYDMLKENWKQQNSIVNNMQNVQHGITNWKLMHFDEVRRKKK